MVDEILKWQEFDVRLSQTFSPAAAISRRDLFRGRQAIVRRLIDTANQAGQHAIIYGERGVGKTSLANVLSDFLQPFTSEQIVSARVNCSRETSYDQIWRSMFREIGSPVEDPYDSLTIDDVFAALRREDSRKLILIIDEFDRIEDPDIDSRFADTIKALSDFNVDTTLILVGVADDVDDLIVEHESIDRCLVQVHLPRMPFVEMTEIVRLGISSVGMEASDEAVSRICLVSMGLPRYAHALGLASGRSAIDRRRTRLESGDVDDAMGVLVNESQQSILHQFDLATASPRRESLYFQVLLACALASTDDLGYFRAADVREPYSLIMNREMEISNFASHLHRLSREDRGDILERQGRSHQYRFRFSNPLMQPYVLMRGLKSGMLSIENLAEFTGETG